MKKARQPNNSKNKPEKNGQACRLINEFCAAQVQTTERKQTKTNGEKFKSEIERDKICGNFQYKIKNE